jgi:hypothetical protein
MSDSTEGPLADGPDPAGDEPVSPAPPAMTGRARPSSPLGRAWRGFRAWRRSRPFWAGVLLIIAGAELLLIPLPIHDMGVILHIGVGGVSGILIGAVLILIGLLLWFHPAQHIFYSIVAVLLALAALIASNLGGFLLGTLLGIIGGSLGFAWMPGRPERRTPGSGWSPTALRKLTLSVTRTRRPTLSPTPKRPPTLRSAQPPRPGRAPTPPQRIR